MCPCVRKEALVLTDLRTPPLAVRRTPRDQMPSAQHDRGRWRILPAPQVCVTLFWKLHVAVRK